MTSPQKNRIPILDRHTKEYDNEDNVSVADALASYILGDISNILPTLYRMYEGLVAHSERHLLLSPYVSVDPTVVAVNN